MPKCPKNPARQLAIELLGTCHSLSETARQVGRNRKTIARWFGQEKFANAVKKRLDRMKLDHTARIYGAIGTAIDALIRNCDDVEHPAAANTAAKIILNRTGMLIPDAPPRDEARVEEVSLGGSLVVMSPEEAAKMSEGEAVIVRLPDTDSPPHVDHLAGPEPDAEADRPTS